MKFLKENRFRLVNGVTPLEQQKFRGVRFFLKRDDLTGTETSGNKIRKLEFLLHDAIKKKATVIYTCGGGQSNHCRATVIAARKAGIPVRLFLWEEPDALSEGNLFLNRLYSKSVEYLEYKSYLNVDRIMAERAAEEEKSGERVYIIPEGGSSPEGIPGAAVCYREIISQLLHMEKRIKSITVAAGSGGTAAGLLLGSSIMNKKTKILAVPVLYEGPEFRERILDLAYRTADKLKVSSKGFNEALELVPGYSKEGYKQTAASTLKVIQEFALESGILFDPVYTGKAFAAFADNLPKNKTNTSGLFIHTGGLFGWFGKGKEREEILTI